MGERGFTRLEARMQRKGRILSFGGEEREGLGGEGVYIRRRDPAARRWIARRTLGREREDDIAVG